MKRILVTLTYADGWMTDDEARAVADAGARAMRSLAHGLPTEVQVSEPEDES